MRLRPSSIVLVLANLVPLGSVLIFDWQVRGMDCQQLRIWYSPRVETHATGGVSPDITLAPAYG